MIKERSFTKIEEKWSFAFDVMQVEPYSDEYKPHPVDTDWIEINCKDNVYEIEFILTGQATGMKNTSTIDVYYKGEAAE